MVKADQIPLEKAVFSDAWELMKAAYDMKDIDANWDYLLEQAESINKRYAGTIVSGLACDLALSVTRHIEAIKRKKAGKGGVINEQYSQLG